jgi:hypothetical protein
LVEFLEDGPHKAADVRIAGNAAGPDRTLDRARNDLGFTSQRIGFGGNTVWFNKEQYGKFQKLLDQVFPADEALCCLDRKFLLESTDGEALQPDDERAEANGHQETNE